MKTADYLAHSEALNKALIYFQTSIGDEKESARAAYLSMTPVVAPEHDADIVAEAHAGNKTAQSLLHWSSE